MGKYLAFYRVGLQNAFAYRGPAIVWKITNLLSLITIVFVWLSSNSNTIGDYSRSQLITYYIFVLVLQWLVNWTPINSIREEIKDGEINSKSLIKPVSYLWQMFAREFAWHTISPVIGFFALAIALTLFHAHLEFSFDLPRLLLFLSILPLSALICFFASFCVGCLAFWFTEVDGLVSLYWLSLYLFSGMGIPLSFFPSPAREIVTFLPFHYIYSFPLDIIFNKLTSLEILTGFLTETLWVGALYLLAKIIWSRGVKVYSAYGG